jgi:hypothetical protein
MLTNFISISREKRSIGTRQVIGDVERREQISNGTML